jgi:hypothetical protein
LKKVPLELLFFISGLLYLFFIEPNAVHFIFCPLAALGFDFCPGCGLGTSLHYFMHGQFKTSLQTHPLGIFTFFVIIYRIYTLTLKSTLLKLKIKKHE